MPPTRYAVRRLTWARNDYADDRYYRLVPEAGTPEVTDLDSYEAAVAECRELEAEARAAANPFEYGGPGLFYQSSLDGPRFHDWLLDAGIDPPPPDDPARRIIWWQTRSANLTPAQREKVWEALDKVRIFEVTEDGPRKAYVVVEVTWTWNDEPWLDADPEGGRPQKAFRDRAKAEAYCEQLNRQKRAENDLGFESFNYEGRAGHRGAGETVYPIEEAAFYEVIEVEAEG